MPWPRPTTRWPVPTPWPSPSSGCRTCPRSWTCWPRCTRPSPSRAPSARARPRPAPKTSGSPVSCAPPSRLTARWPPSGLPSTCVACSRLRRPPPWRAWVSTSASSPRSWTVARWPIAAPSARGESPDR